MIVMKYQAPPLTQYITTKKKNIQKIMLTHPKHIIPRKPNSIQHSEICKAKSHNIKNSDRRDTTHTTKIHPHTRTK